MDAHQKKRRVWFPWIRTSQEKPIRMLALLAFHNEMRYLPGYFENVPPQVSGIVALDDGSVDGSAAFVARQPSVIELLQIPPREPHIWDERINHHLLIQAAWRHQPDWLLAVDADERLEQGFRGRALKAIQRAERKGYLAYAVKFRELWNQPDTYRVDGIWKYKRQARLFKARLDHEFDDRQYHCHWAPLNSTYKGIFLCADLIIYHLHMLRANDRLARQLRNKQLDPDSRWQPMGYDYLTNEVGLRLKKLPRGREYEPLGR